MINVVAKGIRAGITAIAIGTTTFSKNHLIFELSDFFTGFTFLVNFGLLSKFCFSSFIVLPISLYFLRYRDLLYSQAIVNLASQISYQVEIGRDCELALNNL